MPANQFLPFATGGGALVLSYADYLALAARTTGFPAGILPKENLNSAVRQAAFWSAVIGQFCADGSGNDSLDDGDIPTAQANLILAIVAATANIGTGIGTKRYIAAPALLTGGFYLVDTSTGAAQLDLTLPLVNGASRTTIQFEDATNSWDDYPVRLLRNGATIEGVAEDLYLDVSNQQLTLYYDGTTWKVI